MSATWPTGLPCPLLNGFSEQRQRNVASFAPDVGPPKLRRRSTAAAVKTALGFRMTLAELAQFNTFYEDTLEDGALTFTMDHPLTGVSYDWAFAPDEAPQIQRITPGTVRVLVSLLRLP